MALFAFLAVAVIASHLSTRARQKAADASARQRDVEKLYAFSQGLLESRNVMELLNRIPGQIVNAFEVGAAALFLADKQKVYRSGPAIPQLDTESLKSVLARDEPVIDAANSVSFLPVRHGSAPGSAAWEFRDAVLSRQTLEAIATLDRRGDGARARGRAIGANGSRARGGAASHRAARRGDARAAHAAHVHQSFGDESDLEPAAWAAPRGRNC